ncbi:MAG: DUF5674 family protein [Patescibacteria group bacterium]
MIITGTKPFTEGQIEQLSEEFEVFIKTVIDVERKICSAGASRHYENEKVLLEQGSKQTTLWGGGVDLETKDVTIDSMINIRPSVGNRSNQIQDPVIRQQFEDLTKYFFPTVFND